MPCSKKTGFIANHRSIRCIFVGNLTGFIFGSSNFAESEVHMTAIQALSDHKKKYRGRLEEFLVMYSSWKDLLKSGFWRPFSPQSLAIFFRASLRIPFDWIGYLQDQPFCPL